jgi:SEC-C motif-containing protein
VVALQQSCPCGSGTSYDACCGRLHRGAALAVTAEELMRSRYTAYAVGDTDHLFRSWHPRTRPENLATQAEGGLSWHGLEIVDTGAGGPDDDTGEVEFRARYRAGAVTGALHERSRFVRRAGRWVYVDGDVG